MAQVYKVRSSQAVMKILTDTLTEYQQVRNSCGYFFMDDWHLVSVTGKDTFTYLQTQTTNDLRLLQPGRGQSNAIVDRKARLIATFSIHKTSETSAIILIEKTQQPQLIKHLNTYLFREDVKIYERSDKLIALQGPKSTLVLQNLAKQPIPEKTNDIIEYTQRNLLAINKSLTGEEGFVIGYSLISREIMTDLISTAGSKYSIASISTETQEILRIEAGMPFYGKDMDESNILPETGLEQTSVSYNKGCYIGQEVITRIKTYGAPPIALMGLVIEGDSSLPYNADMRVETKKFGTIKSSSYSYSLGKNVALAYVQKEFRNPGERTITVDGTPYKVNTVLLPFYQVKSGKDHALRLYNEALKYYKEQENLDKPITLLREAIEIDPKLSCAYEALGVLLSRQDKLDEAIVLMQRLAELDPSEIMAHTNLSIYYMKLGRIEDAEKEKAEATALQFEKTIAQNMSKKSEKINQAKKREEQLNKLEMFKKVLEIDPVDQVANYGLGSVYLELERYEEALPHLQLLVEKYKKYSTAYLLLGKTLEKLSRTKETIEVYQAGITVAAQNGDLMPLKDMQNRLNQILHSGSEAQTDSTDPH